MPAIAPLRAFRIRADLTLAQIQVHPAFDFDELAAIAGLRWNQLTAL
jgi:hypothetical protein